MKGDCLCGEVRFEVDGALPNLYQCHCSLCRKATGAAANAATFVHKQNFRWLAGQHKIASFQKPSGYRSDFCSLCGSPVPNPLSGTDLVWIPVGLLNGPLQAEIKAHLHLSASASWERDAADCLRLAAGPDSLDSLHRVLQQTNR
ncbi:aldehyde-activating protein [Alkalilimnicola ehrlichii]|uniref:Aldehyde-activating protein n=1 Tax=Alkalilimnicola ehrlichii TaxID=351052 RepID=A0A3E0WWM6_9GAMM|nr:aldehyde-activating protein [Alkalilimnicola ehrlichii]RFA36789.1 aldehyde-activating protein [Alkalilimnicola ehrlichii]